MQGIESDARARHLEATQAPSPQCAEMRLFFSFGAPLDRSDVSGIELESEWGLCRPVVAAPRDPLAILAAVARQHGGCRRHRDAPLHDAGPSSRGAAAVEP